MQGLTPQQLHWNPPGKANNIAACYTHVILGEDVIIQMMAHGKPPLAATTFAGKVGLSGMPPLGDVGGWFEWGHKVRLDANAMRPYSQAVAAATDSYFASLKESDLVRKIKTPVGEQPLLWCFSIALIGHVHDFTGEISCVEGLQGLTGYPA
ncbi:MAG: DinB family protein [Dehalococcoidia bacterium]|nr:DinB family protein [Dehalococcoidia bacterium]